MSNFEQRSRKKSVCYTKPNIVYIEAYGISEQVEISPHCTSEDIQDVLRSICGAGRRDVIKLTNYQNIVLPLELYSLVSNHSSQPYHVEVISCCPQLYTSLVSQGARRSLQDLDQRVQNVELKMHSLFQKVEESSSSHIVALEGRINKLQDQVRSVHLSRQMERINPTLLRPRNTSEMFVRCSICPYFSNIHHLQQYVHLQDAVITETKKTPSCNWQRISKTHEQIHTVWIQYQAIQMNEIRRPVRESMKLPTFNMWGFSDAELLQLVKSMFLDLQLTTRFSIPTVTLDKWLFAVYQNYNSVPFHNFTHAFCVVQMVYAVIHITKLKEHVDDLEILILIFSAICHDLDHPGLNNAFQINARTCLAQRYNDQSPLENHHCAMAFQVLEDDDKNILKQLTEKQFKKLREVSIKCILATDMARHGDILSDFRNIIHNIDITNDPNHRIMIMVVIIKACDVSNEARPPNVSEPWLECLLEEFFQQSDLEKKKGLPFASFMDRDKVTKSNSQCGFIKFVILPLLELLVEMFPCLEDQLIKPVKSQLEYYSVQQNRAGNNLREKSSSPVTFPTMGPIRKTSTGSIPSRKSSAGCISRRQSLSVNDALQGNVISPVRKTSTGSIPSRKSSTGSLVLAQS